MRTRPENGASLEVLRARLSRLPSRPAPAEFHARLRSQFVRDAIPAPASRRWSRPIAAAAALSTAAAAALLAVAILGSGPAWELLTVTGSGVARIDGADVPLSVPDALARRLRAGAEVVLPADAQLDLRLPGIAVLQITGGTRMVVPARPHRWLARTITTSLESGELRLSTGPGFAGRRLTVVTPEMRVSIEGTTLAVLRDQDASCVCVFDGRVAMTGGGATDTVHAGTRRSVFRTGGPPLLEPIRPMEAMKLGMLRDLADRALAR